MYTILISSCILILLVIGLRKLAWKKISPTLQYGLWLLVAIRLLLPFQIGSSSLSLENLFPQKTLVQEEVQIPTSDTHDLPNQSPITSPTSTEAMLELLPTEQAMEEFPLPSEESPVQEVVPVAPHPNETQVSDTMAGTPSGSVEQTQKSRLTLSANQILNLVWFIGFVTMAAWFTAVNIRFQKTAMEDAVRIEVPQIPLPVYESNNILSPCMVGLLRPRILLSPGDTPSSRAHILTHEYTHYRHKDHIWSFIRGLCLCIHWFNPLVWVAAYLSKEDCEMACDHSTINTLGDSERIPYGYTLVETVKKAGHPDSLLCSATTMGGGMNQMRRRFNRITQKPKKLLWVAISLLLVLALAVGCTFTGGKNATQAPTEETIDATVPTEGDVSTETTAKEEGTESTELPSLINPSGVELIDGWFGEVVTVDKAGGYAIPHLFLETEYGEQVNQEILDRFGMIAEGDRSQYTGLTYNWYLTVLEHFDPSPQVLVLDITATTVQGTTEKLTYYVDLAYGSELSARGYASNIQYRVSRELVQELYDEFANTGAISFTSEDRDVYLENLTRSYQEATFALTEQGTLAITIPYITLDGSIRDIPMNCEPTKSISVNAFHEPDVIDLYTYTSKNGTENTIPLILLESVYAKKLNAYILNEYLTLQPDHLTYTEAIHGEILSFSMKAEDPNTYDLMCLAENLFLDGSSAPTAEAVLSQGKGSMTYEEYTEKARVLLPSYFFDLFPGITEQFPNDKMVLKQVKRSGSSPNIALSTPYLDEDGNVWARAYIYQIAGSSHTAHLIPISTGKINEEYVKYAEENNLFLQGEQALLKYLQTLYGEGTYDLIYSAENAYPEYVDDKLHAEGLDDHVLIRIVRKLDPTMTEADIEAIPELKAACEILGVEKIEHFANTSSPANIREMYVMDSTDVTFTGPIDRYVKVVWDSANKEVHILIYWG